VRLRDAGEECRGGCLQPFPMMISGKNGILT